VCVCVCVCVRVLFHLELLSKLISNIKVTGQSSWSQNLKMFLFSYV